MAGISEISGDSNDGDTNKNPREESKKQQEEVVAKPKTRGTRNPLPDELLETLFALLSRWEYPKLPVVCPDYRRVIASPLLYGERLKIGNTEAVLYALIGFPVYTLPSWYILNKTNGSFHLSQIKSLANMPYGSAVVTIGLDLYVIGGCVGQYCTSSVLRINCTTHKYEMLQSMRRARSRPVAGVIDGNIYVIGGCEIGASDDWVEVFDVKNQVWSPLPGPYVYASDQAEFLTSAVIEDKIYILDHLSCFTYEPKKHTWDTDTSLFNPLRSLWQQCSCVVDDVFFSINPQNACAYSIVAFDPKENFWRTVTIILGRFHMPKFSYYDAKMANLGGNLVILGRKNSHTEIWYIEITLERHKNGYFTGTIVRVERVLTPSDATYIEHCRAVTV